MLNNVLNYLTENPELKFIWTEISFFNLWWTELSSVDRERVKMYIQIPFTDSVNKGSYAIVFPRRIIDRKQLEFTAEGWVMRLMRRMCIIVSHLTQLFEGHQWLKEHLDFTPKFVAVPSKYQMLQEFSL